MWQNKITLEDSNYLISLNVERIQGFLIQQPRKNQFPKNKRNFASELILNLILAYWNAVLVFRVAWSRSFDSNKSGNYEQTYENTFKYTYLKTMTPREFMDKRVGSSDWERAKKAANMSEIILLNSPLSFSKFAWLHLAHRKRHQDTGTPVRKRHHPI